MKESTYFAYWTGYTDAIVVYGNPLWGVIQAAEPDWHEQDLAMLAALNAD